MMIREPKQKPSTRFGFCSVTLSFFCYSTVTDGRRRINIFSRLLGSLRVSHLDTRYKTVPERSITCSIMIIERHKSPAFEYSSLHVDSLL